MALVCVIAFAFAPGAEEAGQLKAGAEAPAFMLKNLQGEWVSLRDFCGVLRNPWKNKTKYVVVLSFWATYCKPCEKEIPQLEELVAPYADKVRVFLVSIDEQGKPLVEPLVKQRGYRSDVLLDLYQKTAQKYGVKGIPALFLLGSEGTIQYAAYGYDPEKGLTPLKEKLWELLGIKMPEPQKPDSGADRSEAEE
jgi:thiol-disulfide isomerase/thioredoxin